MFTAPIRLPGNCNEVVAHAARYGSHSLGTARSGSGVRGHGGAGAEFAGWPRCARGHRLPQVCFVHD